MSLCTRRRVVSLLRRDKIDIQADEQVLDETIAMKDDEAPKKALGR